MFGTSFRKMRRPSGAFFVYKKPRDRRGGLRGRGDASEVCADPAADTLLRNGRAVRQTAGTPARRSYGHGAAKLSPVALKAAAAPRQGAARLRRPSRRRPRRGKGICPAGTVSECRGGASSRCAAALSYCPDQREGTSSPPSKRYCAIFTSAFASLQYQSAPIFFA